MQKKWSKTGLGPRENRIRYWMILSAVSIFTVAACHNTPAEVLTLKEGLQIAEENSRLIRIAQCEESIAEADNRFAKSFMLPEISTSLSQTWLAYQPGIILGGMSVPISDKDMFSFSLNVRQILFDFRANASRYQASGAILNTKRLDTEKIKNLVAVEFIHAYLDLLESEKMLLVAEKELERLESHCRTARAFYEEGVITKNDLLQAEVRISDAKQRLLGVENARAMAASKLNYLMTRPLDAEIQVQDMEELPEGIMTRDLEEAWRTAEAERQEIHIADEIIRSLDLDIKSKRAEYYPEFFLQGGYDYVQNSYQVYEGNWSIILGMQLDLYNGGRKGVELSKTESQKKQLVEQKNKLVDEIKLEVEGYMLAFENARERLAVTVDAIEQGEENLRITKVKYEEGAGTATDVLDAVTLATIAETNYYRSLYDVRKAEASLLYAMGKDLMEVYQ